MEPGQLWVGVVMHWVGVIKHSDSHRENLEDSERAVMGEGVSMYLPLSFWGGIRSVTLSVRMFRDSVAFSGDLLMGLTPNHSLEFLDFAVLSFAELLL